jgi:hypothetical protein
LIITTEARFLAQVAQHPGGCWTWTGTTDTGGYGLFRYANRQRGAHRFSYEFYVGPIPKGYDIHHRCGIKLCVCPEHLAPLARSQHIELHRAGRRRSEVTPDLVILDEAGTRNAL